MSANNWLKWLIACLFCISVKLLTAQDAFVAMKHLSTADGLSENTNSFIYKDSHGFVWISSLNGLNRFDGQHVKVYTPAENDPSGILGNMVISPIFEDTRGDIWFSTDKAINRYNRKSDSFSCFFTNNKAHSPPIAEYNAIYLDKNGQLWFSTNDSLFIIQTQHPDDHARFIAPLAKGVRFAVNTDPQGIVTSLTNCFWDFGNGFEILYFDNDQKVISRKQYFTERDLNPLICRQAIADGNVFWFATDKGMLQWNAFSPNEYHLYTDNNKAPSIQGLSATKDQNIVVASSTGAVLFFNKNTKQFSSYPETANEHQRAAWETVSANSVSVTSDGIVWMGKYGEGLRYAQPNNYRFRNYHLSGDEKNFVTTQLTEDANGSIWCTTRSNQVWSLSDGNWQSITASGRFAKIFCDVSGQYKTISTGGIAKINVNRPALQELAAIHGLPFSEYYVLPDNQDNYFLGTNKGLFTLHANNWTLEKSTFANFFVSFLLQDKHQQLWIGNGEQEGVDIYRRQGDSLSAITSIRNIGIVNHMVTDAINDDFIWVASSKGLSHINVNTFENQLYNKDHGLPDDYVYAIVPADSNSVWLSTSQGIVHFNFEKHFYKKYTAKDGLMEGAFCRNAALRDANGYIWLGSTKGVTVFHPDSITDIGRAPQIAIVGLRIHDQEWRGDTAIEMVRQIDLPYNKNTLRLELAAMEYLNPGYNQFRVMLQLEGENATWTDLGTQNFVTYANLKPGNYTFRMVACNAEGIWVEEKDARILHIHIHPHWSDTWWFRTLLVALLLAIVAAVTAFYYRYRLRAQQLLLEQQQRKAERERLELEKNAAAADSLRQIAESEMKLLRAQLNPHFLFNAMNSINRYILSNEKDKASEYLGQFAQLTRSILDNSRNLRIPLADELKMLHQYLALENHRFEQQIHWTINISPEVDEENLLVPSMVLQPFAENAVLHGLAPKNGGYITIDICQQDERLQCTITDNGVGRRATPGSSGKARHASAGMGLVTERIDAFAAVEGQSASFNIIDLKDDDGNAAGTSVIIQLPWVEAI